MKANLCPSQNELLDFESGVLSTEQFDSIAEHLESCSECAARFEKLEPPPDRVVEQLRERLPEEMLSDDLELDRLVARAAALQQTSANAAGETNADAASRRRAKVEEWVLQVLAPPQGADEIGRLAGYRVLRVLGMGGMGVVLLAEDVGLKRLVALKVMSPKVASTSARARFLREAQSNAAVRHDNVVTIFQVGEDRGVPFLAMELLEGESLADRLQRQQKLPVHEALQIARETAQGLAAAHAKGLTHRDIKPDNIWLESSRLAPRDDSRGAVSVQTQNGVSGANDAGGRDGFPVAERQGYCERQGYRVKILDFGLARAVDDEQHLTQSGAIVGTPNYLSPEQAAGAAVDARTDLFSLGVVLYEMLCGRKPFAQPSLMATLKAIGTDPPRELDADIPADVAAMVKRLLEKRPEDRFGSCAEVIAAVERCQQTEPATAVASRKVKTKRTWIATAVACVLMFGVIVTVKDKNGKTLLRYVVPDGGTVEVASGKTDADGKKGGDSVLSEPATPADSTRHAEPPVVADHLPPMSSMALVQRPPKLVAKDGEAVESWTLLPVAVPPNAARALSLDGSRLATFGSDGAVRVWDVDQKKLLTVLIGHAAGPCSPAGKPEDRSNWGYRQTNSRRFGPIAWRPQAERTSSWLATASRDGSVRVWDVANGKTVWKNAREGDLINMLAWSPDGTKLAVGYDDGQVHAWDAETGKEIGALALVEGPPFGLGWSPDSRLLAVHSSAAAQAISGSILVWDIASGKQQHLNSTGVQNGSLGQNHWHGISAMRWSPDGKHLAVKGNESLLIHETTEWKPTHRLTSGLKDKVHVQDFDWSPDGTKLLVSWDGQLQLHELKENKATSVPLKGRQLALKIEWAPGSSRAAIWIQDGVFGRSAILETRGLELRDIGSDQVSEFGASDKRLLGFSAVVPVVLQLDGDNATAWNPRAQPVSQRQPHLPVWSPDGAMAKLPGAAWISDNSIYSWSTPARNFVSWAAEHKMVVMADGNALDYELWSLPEQRRLSVLDLPSVPKPQVGLALSFSPDGSRIAVGGQDGFKGDILILDGSSGALKRRVKIGGSGEKHDVTRAIRWSNRGDRIAVARDSYSSADNPRYRVFVVDTNDDQIVSQPVPSKLPGLTHGDPTHGLRWSPDDRRLLVRGTQEISIFASDTGTYETGFALRANLQAIQFLDAGHILCGTEDGAVERLDMLTGQQATIARDLGNVVEISPDGQLLAVDRGSLSIHRQNGEMVSSVFLLHDPAQPCIVSTDGHFWSNDQAQGPFWATKGNVPGSLIYVVQTASGQKTLTPLEFANRYGWRNDPARVKLK